MESKIQTGYLVLQIFLAIHPLWRKRRSSTPLPCYNSFKQGANYGHTCCEYNYQNDRAAS
jgi:hypothetical protein